MLFVILSWLILWATILGIGHLARILLLRAGGRSFAAPLDLFQTFWIGFALLVAFLQFYSLWFPLDGASLVLVLLTGGAGLIALLHHQRRILTGAGTVGRLLDVRNACFFLAAAGVLVKAASGVATIQWGGWPTYDTDLYHFSWIRWANEYPAVPGLANLHCRLGLNSSLLLLAALSDSGIWDLRSSWLTGGLVILPVIFQWLRFIIHRPRAPLHATLFAVFTLPYLLYWGSVLSPSLSYERPAQMLQMVLFLEMLRTPWPSRHDPSARLYFLRRWRIQSCLLLSVASVAYTGLSSSLPGLAVAVLFVLTMARCAARTTERPIGSWRATAAVAALPALVVAGFLVRNIILSGWIFYPTPVGNLHLAWSVPAQPSGQSLADRLQSVNGFAQSIQTLPKIGRPVYSDAARVPLRVWFPIWYQRNTTSAELRLFAVACAAWVLWAAAAFWKRRLPAVPARWVAGGIMASLIIWFLTAPDLRSGDSLIWMWTAMGFSLLMAALPLEPRAIKGLAALVFVVMAVWSTLDYGVRERPTLWTVGRAAPRSTRPVTIDNGQQPPLVVNVPLAATDARCGDAPLPCTPYPRDSLMLRVPGDLRHGFRVRPTP